MNKVLILSFVWLAFAGQNLSAQPAPNAWKTLGKVTYKKEFDETLGYNIEVPLFSKEVLSLQGKEITLKGYIIPTDGYKSHKDFIFSAYPYSMCFFCGAAGPESVIEIKADTPISYTVDPITIKGKLELNSTDINRLMYGLVHVTKVN
jgi:hypothetical protein